MRNDPQVELLWWQGCPSTEHALRMLRDALEELGLASTIVQMVEVASEQEAVARGFWGSPTIRIDGVDIVALAGTGMQDPPASASLLSCRVYRRRDGRISPTPDPEDIREALVRAVRARERPVSAR